MKVKYSILKGENGIVPSWFDNRYHQKQLGGWKNTYGSDDVDETKLSSASHLLAGDLSERYNLLGKYITSGNVGKDILSYADLSGITDINKFITDYNNNIRTLNNFFTKDLYYKAANGNNPTDATSHNLLYKKMFSSRSALSDIGYLENLEGLTGSSTWLRIPDQYEKEYEDLSDSEKVARTHEVILNGLKHTVVKNSDGTIKLLPPKSEITQTQQNRLKIQPLLLQKLKSNYPGWSDWLPLTAKKIVDDIAAVRTGILERQKKFPLFEAPNKRAIVTDAYAERQLLEKQKQEALARSGYSPTSDLTLNLVARAKGEQIASEISDKQVALKAKRFAETLKLVQDVANENNMYRTNVANLNRLSNVAAMNSIIDSRIKQIERLATNLGTYIGDMYTNYGEYLKTKRLNQNANKRLLAFADYKQSRAAAYKPYFDLYENPASWNKINNFITEFSAEGAPGLTDDQIRIWNLQNLANPEYKNLIVDLLKNSSSNTAKKYRAIYLQELSDLEKQGRNLDEIALSKLNNILASIDTYVTNQWGWNPQSKVRKSVLSQKSGGRLTDNFSRLERIRQKEQQSVRENTQKRNKMLSDNLNKQLDRISHEELTLLRAIFK